MAFKAKNSVISVKRLFVVVIFVSAVVSTTFSAKLSRSSHHGAQEKEGADLSLETLLLRDKLNLILDAESREVTLLKNLLDESHENGNGNSFAHGATASNGGEDSSVEKNELDKSHKSQSDSLATAKTPRTTDDAWSTHEMTSTSSPEKVVATSENVDSLAYLREHGIVSKLEENTKRMEKMVIFMVDLRNLLTEALTVQARQTEFETEMVEIREEMEYLRKELYTLKKEKTRSSSVSADVAGGETNTHLENKLHNEDVTIEWLRDSTKELRTQMKEISESCNVTVIAQMKDLIERERARSNGDLAAAEKELGALRLKQLRQDEQISESKANIEDLRSWQVKMGQALIQNKNSPIIIDNNEESLEEKTNSVEFGDEHFITEALKDAVGKPTRHNNKRLKSKVHELQTLIQDLIKDNKNYRKRLVKIENSQRYLKNTANNLKETLAQAGFIMDSSSGVSAGNRARRHINTDSNGQITKRLGSLEKTMQEYLITLENLNDKAGAVEELQESSTQLFRTLETLETKYDERVTELQTGLARLDASVSSVLVVNDDLKEQQTQQNGLMQSVKKELFETKGKLQANHLRLASMQSQLLKWASQKCSDENSESIQNIRIATLEQKVQDVERSP